MKKSLGYLTIAVSLFSGSLLAEEVPSVKEITRQIIVATTKYANAVSCGGVQITPKQIAALAPYKDFYAREEAEYAVLWDGDIGCLGGSGTSNPQVAIVKIGAGDSFMVDAQHSSPAIEFASPVRYIERLVGNNRDSLILEGLEYGSNDSQSTPSIRVRFVMMRDNKGNWKTVSKEVRGYQRD